MTANRTGFSCAAVFGIAGILAFGPARGADWFVKADASDFASAASYTNASGQAAAAVPGDADVIHLPNATFAVEAPSASFTALSGVKRIVPSTDTRLEIDVPNAADSVTLDPPFNNGGEAGLGAAIGTLVKTGAGTLALASDAQVIYPASGYAFDYCTRIVLEGGTLACPRERSVARTVYGTLTTAAGTVLEMSAHPDRTSTAWAEVDVVFLDGALTNAHATVTRTLNLHGKAGIVSRVAGPAGGNLRFWTSGSIDFSHDASTMNGSLTVSSWSPTGDGSLGIAGLTSFGMSGAPSSAGTANAFTAYGPGGFRYLGTEPETTDKYLSNYGTLMLSGGEHGGVTFTGTLSASADSAARSGQHLLYLEGSNTSAACTFRGKMAANTAYGAAPGAPAEYSNYVIKRGTGAWLFSGRKLASGKGWNAGLAVQEGEFRFDSILESGFDCALGTMTKWTDGTYGEYAPEHMTDYAIALGSAAPAAPATLAYVGATRGTSTTRPLALAGTGGTLKADAGAFAFGGVKARDADTSPTLTLAGSGTAGNVVRDVSDGAAGAHVNVTKEGTGTWTLGGDLTFSGDLAVKGGTLAVDVPATGRTVHKDYKWFRLSIADIASNNGVPGSKTLDLRSISLFDRNGVRQNVGLRLAEGSYVVGHAKPL